MSDSGDKELDKRRELEAEREHYGQSKDTSTNKPKTTTTALSYPVTYGGSTSDHIESLPSPTQPQTLPIDASKLRGASGSETIEPDSTATPSDVYFDPTKPACLQHGYGHWTKDCPELQPDSTGELDAFIDEYFHEQHEDSDSQTCASLYLVNPKGKRVYLYRASRHQDKTYSKQDCDCGVETNRKELKAALQARESTAYKQGQADVLDRVEKELPKEVRLRSSPNNEERRMKAMWNRGYNRYSEACRAVIDKYRKEL